MNVYKSEKHKFDKLFLSFRPNNIFIGTSEVCKLTEVSGAVDNSSDFDGNTTLLECEDNEYVYISGLEIFNFKTDDKPIDYISLMDNNMIPYAIIIGEKYTYFISHHYKFFEKDNIEQGTLLNTINGSLDPFDYHVENCGVHSFKKLERSLIRTSWPGVGKGDEDVEEDEEDKDLIETQYLNGNNQVVKIFNQKCVLCYKRDSDYAFRQCGHQCICEECNHNKSDIDILKCVVCRT